MQICSKALKHHKHFRSMASFWMHSTYMKIQPKLCLDNASLGQDQVASWFYKTVSPIAVRKFPSVSTSTQGRPLSFHMLHAPSLVQHNVPAPHFLPFMLYSAAHTKIRWWPWLACICSMTPCLELPAPLCTCPSGFATSSVLMAQHNLSPVCASPP